MELFYSRKEWFYSRIVPIYSRKGWFYSRKVDLHSW